MNAQPVPVSAGIRAIGLLGQGISSWPHGSAVLAASKPYLPAATLIPTAMSLPPAERRRAVRIVNLALAVGHEATCGIEVDLTSLPTVFASSVADSTNCHELLQTLATAGAPGVADSVSQLRTQCGCGLLEYRNPGHGLLHHGIGIRRQLRGGID